MGKKIFTADQQQEVAKFVPGHTYVQIGCFVQSHYGIEFPPDRVKSWLSNHHLSTGLDGQFKKGRKASIATQFKSGERVSPKTEFKPGHKPNNWKPIGTVIMKADGYLWTKIRDDGVLYKRWHQTHILNWEKANGPVEPGMRLVFLDGDHHNVNVSNLRMVTNAELLAFNQRKLASKDPNTTESAILLAKLETKANMIRRKKKIKRPRGVHPSRHDRED